VECDAIESGRSSPTFRSNFLPPSSGLRLTPVEVRNSQRLPIRDFHSRKADTQLWDGKTWSPALQRRFGVPLPLDDNPFAVEINNNKMKIEERGSEASFTLQDRVFS
jgi:hypothetical protein